MKVGIYSTSRADLLKVYPLLKEYENFYNLDGNYWRTNSIIKEMDDDELFKVIQMLSINYGEIIVNYGRDGQDYGIDFSIEIYDDWRE